jgi:hypothetical protein
MSYSPKELLVFSGAIFQRLLHFYLTFHIHKGPGWSPYISFCSATIFLLSLKFLCVYIYIYIVKGSSKRVFLLTRRQFSSNKFLTWVWGLLQSICEKPLLASSCLSIYRFSTQKLLTPSRCIFHKFCVWDFYYKFLNIFCFLRAYKYKRRATWQTVCCFHNKICSLFFFSFSFFHNFFLSQLYRVFWRYPIFYYSNQCTINLL